MVAGLRRRCPGSGESTFRREGMCKKVKPMGEKEGYLQWVQRDGLDLGRDTLFSKIARKGVCKWPPVLVP